MIWVEISVSVVSILRFGLRFRSQACGFQVLDRNFSFGAADLRIGLEISVSDVGVAGFDLKSLFCR